jgi:hypothetical protein
MSPHGESLLAQVPSIGYSPEKVEPETRYSIVLSSKALLSKTSLTGTVSWNKIFRVLQRLLDVVARVLAVYGH